MYILNNLTNFRHIVLQSARKLNPDFANKMGIFLQINVIFMTNLFFRYCHSCLTFFSRVQHSWYKKQPQKRRQNWSNKFVANSNIKLTQILTALLHERAYLKDYRILSKNALTNWYVRCVSSNQVIREFNKTI